MSRKLSEMMQESGIHGLKTYRIAENDFFESSNVIGYAFRNGAWIIYDFDERCQLSVYNKYDTEEEAVTELFRLVNAFYLSGK